jgi:hypothetical protein
MSWYRPRRSRCARKLSPMSDPQFKLVALYPANWDRCKRCGAPRKVHGADGSCGLTLGLGRSRTRLLGVGGTAAALGGAGWLLATAPAIPPATVLAFVCLVAIILLVGALAIAGR